MEQKFLISMEVPSLYKGRIKECFRSVGAMVSDTEWLMKVELDRIEERKLSLGNLLADCQRLE